MTRYGNNFVLIRMKNGQSKEEIINGYNKFAQNTRQKIRKIRDREFLNSIPDGEYQAVVRQYTGYKDIPAQVRENGRLYDIVWISGVIRW